MGTHKFNNFINENISSNNIVDKYEEFINHRLKAEEIILQLKGHRKDMIEYIEMVLMRFYKEHKEEVENSMDFIRTISKHASEYNESAYNTITKILDITIPNEDKTEVVSHFGYDKHNIYNFEVRNNIIYIVLETGGYHTVRFRDLNTENLTELYINIRSITYLTNLLTNKYFKKLNK